MSDKKSLGQIAHEAGERICGWARRWDGMSESQRQEWEQIAEAVVAAAQSVDVAQAPGEQASDAYADAVVRLVEREGMREALSIVTASFVGLVTTAMEQAGHKPDGQIRIDGGKSRDITIHAAKGGDHA